MDTSLPAQSDEKPTKTRKVSARIRHAVDLIVSGECRLQKDAAAKANISPERLSRALKESHVISYLEQQTRISIARLQAPAAGRLAHLLANAQSEHVQKDIAIHTLSIAGIKPRADAQVSVNIDIKAGYVIDLTDEPHLVQPSGARIATTSSHNQVIDNAQD